MSSHRLVAIALALSITVTMQPAAHSRPSLHETLIPLANVPITNVPGKRLVSVIVDYPPGAKSLPHRHAASAFIYAYVLVGEIRSAVEGEAARVYRAGEGWIEKPGAHHVVSENASPIDPARMLVIFVVDETKGELTTPDPQ